MYDFDVYFVEPDGAMNHSIVSAKYLNEAAEYVESTKGGIVYEVKCREIDRMRNDSIRVAKSTIKRMSFNAV